MAAAALTDRAPFSSHGNFRLRNCCKTDGFSNSFRERGGRATSATAQAAFITRENLIVQALFGENGQGTRLTGEAAVSQTILVYVYTLDSNSC